MKSIGYTLGCHPRLLILLSAWAIAAGETMGGFVGANELSHDSTNSGLDAAQPAFVYPVRPGTLEWKERILAGISPWDITQLPAGMPARLSTDKLVDVCLRYPMAGDLAAFDSPSKGLKAMRRRFNALDELLRRPDAGKHLVEHFRRMPLEKIPESHSADQQPNLFSMALIIAMLSQESIQETLSRDDALHLAEVCLRGNHTLRKAHLRLSGSEGPAKGSLVTLAAATMFKHGIVVKHGREALAPEDFDPIQKDALIKFSSQEDGVELSQPGAYEKWQAAIEKLEAMADLMAGE